MENSKPRSASFRGQGQLLIAGGNLSKILFAGGVRKGRSVDLRVALSVSDASPIASREVRNSFEHFDERLEAWAASSKRRNIVDSNVIPPGAIVGIDPEDYLRNLDPVTLAVTFRGERVEIVPLVEEAARIHNSAERALAVLMMPPGLSVRETAPRGGEVQ
jgi:hypothetical protein